jgi:UDP-N-acetylmuramyl pentapeptide phosphotransferase/UDP-N-acetylglucosamine-1-phosphate transferase
MESFAAAGLVVLVFAASLAGTAGVVRVLRRRAILDHPTGRSSHAEPTPRGAGLAVVPVLVAAWLVIGLGAPGGPWDIAIVCACALGLAALSWLDDLKGLPALLRLLGQAVAVAVVLAAAPGGGPYFAGLLPPALDVLAAGLLWLWFVNLFNFMDGIDGIAGTETACVGAGVALAAALAGLHGALPFYGLTAAAAALGFLWWNWQPARIFLGDVGSVPLGFLLGWLLLDLAARGEWAAALILPLYYLTDATVTLVHRAWRGERVWRAHREHYYQRAAQRGLSHGAVVRAVLAANVILAALAALAALGWAWQAMAVACAVVAALLYYLEAVPAAGPETQPRPDR